MSQESSEESSLHSSDSFEISPRKSPLPYPPAPFKGQHEPASSSPRMYPRSMRAYNKKDHDYLASFYGRTKLYQTEPTVRSQCQEICAQDTVGSSSLHPPKKRGVSRAQSLPEPLQMPAKELTEAKTLSSTISSPSKWSPSGWSRYFVSPWTTKK